MILAALDGDDRNEHIFALTHSLDLYLFDHAKADGCDRKLEAAFAALRVLAADDVPGPPKARKKGKQINAPAFYIHAARVGFGRPTSPRSTALAPKLVGDCDTYLRAWPSTKYFNSWHCLTPEQNSSGELLMSQALDPAAGLPRSCG